MGFPSRAREPACHCTKTKRKKRKKGKKKNGREKGEKRQNELYWKSSCSPQRMSHFGKQPEDLLQRFTVKILDSQRGGRWKKNKIKITAFLNTFFTGIACCCYNEGNHNASYSCLDTNVFSKENRNFAFQKHPQFFRVH